MFPIDNNQHPNYQLAHSYFIKAAAQRHRKSCCFLGLLYEYGCGVESPSLQAALYFYGSYSQVDTLFPLQQLILGVCFLCDMKHGNGVNWDNAEDFINGQISYF